MLPSARRLVPHASSSCTSHAQCQVSKAAVLILLTAFWVLADVSGLYMISTFDNAESMCTAQGALSAAYAAPGTAPKAFYQADYASCTVASVGTCAGYSSQLTTPLPACSPAI